MALLAFHHITKRFGSLIANNDITLSLESGEVLALLGENGAGKTTLMNILYGHYTADEGHIEVDGTTLPPGSTDAAIKAGIGMVHQHFTLAENLTVLENIMLGTESLWSFSQKQSPARKKLAQMSKDYGLAVAPDTPVSRLSVGERQRVEILKALYRDARVLILDEPTAVLTPQEAESLFTTLESLTKQGFAIIFISHKLHEILRISDRVAVLRRGQIVGSVATVDADRSSLAEMMVGRKVERPRLAPMPIGKAVVRLEGVTLQNRNEVPRLDQISLSVHQHQIIGIAGVAGNGQSALADLLSGLSSPTSGTFELLDQAVTRASPANIVHRGVGRIPEDRHHSGVVGDMTLWENLISEDLRVPPVSRGGFLIDQKACMKRAEKLIEQFDIRCEGPEAETKLLSGGNMQKLILARALSPNPGFILANQPVRGLDEGAIAYVHGQLLAARQRGAGILLISEDLDELFSLCDRIAVIYHGKLTRSFDAKSVTAGQLGLMMAGQDPGDIELPSGQTLEQAKASITDALQNQGTQTHAD
ncbi:ABC transporter ATP-binding protein [Kiloniella laminariae]|uniref:ABC transporter ATP-binding protein n=1 Tax=Kiloniella laminariae TaxID=454162 RepID=UPI00037D76E6|nr:ABC transporter ATP-binding protein [Kiloniella laminariae]